jgi:hypothetical protein
MPFCLMVLTVVWPSPTTVNPSLHEFPKTWKKFSPYKIHPETQQTLQKNNFIGNFLNFNENLYMYHIWYAMVIVNFYIMWICITYDTTCLLTTSQWRPYDYWGGLRKILTSFKAVKHFSEFLFFLRASWKHVVMISDWCTTSCSLV